MSCLIVIDVQNDFLDNGSFAIKNSRTIIPAINRQLDKHWDLVVGTRDWHPKNHISFATTQNVPEYDPIVLIDGGKTINTLAWPVHCVENTKGAEFDTDLHSDKFQQVLSKGTDVNRECFSGFDDVFGRKTELDAILKQHNITTVYLTGVATEYCVCQTALSALRYGYKTIVLEDCIYGVTPEGSVKALEEMKSKGVIIKSSSRDLP